MDIDKGSEMFEKIKEWWGRKDDDVIHSVEDLKRAVPDLRIFVLPDLPEPDLKLYRGPENDQTESK